MLLPLAGLCMDAAVNRFIIRERLGTKEIREQAFRELEKAEEEQVSDKAGTDLIHRIRLLYIRHVLENTDDEGMDPQAEMCIRDRSNFVRILFYPFLDKTHYLSHSFIDLSTISILYTPP